MLHRPVKSDRPPHVARGEESRLGLRPGEFQRLRVRQDVKAAQHRGNGPQVRQTQAPRDRHCGFQWKIGQQVSEEQGDWEGSAERPPKKPVSSRDPFRRALRGSPRLRKEDLQQPESLKIFDRPGGIRGEGADQFDRDAVRRGGREETRTEAANRGCRGRVENETLPLVLQPDRANDPERIFPEPVRRFPHATDPFPEHVIDAAEGIEQAPVRNGAVGGEPEEETVEGEVPPRRVIDSLPVRRPWMAKCRDRQGCPGLCRPGRWPWMAKCRDRQGCPGFCRPGRRPWMANTARVGDVYVLLPPIDRDPVHREMPARRHDLSNARNRGGKRPENVTGSPVSETRDQQVDVPRLPPLDDVPQVPPDQIYRPPGALDRLRKVPEKPSQARSAAQRATQRLAQRRWPGMAKCRDRQGCPGLRCPGRWPGMAKCRDGQGCPGFFCPGPI